MSGIYDDGASYGADLGADLAQDPSADPIYDDVDWYGPPRAARTATAATEQRPPLPAP
ncbi:hypothetical protein [Streptomyces sp. MMBL 11-1]|uniref:hypothetical protein n=1 Tax=Streptomyces sp. MMBL 11-1 TaxID=3026420 RepID=UPI00235E7603|nr:hypothetical protein [Streptomyces sp. MMBL 11-1]